MLTFGTTLLNSKLFIFTRHQLKWSICLRIKKTICKWDFWGRVVIVYQHYIYEHVFNMIETLGRSRPNSTELGPFYRRMQHMYIVLKCPYTVHPRNYAHHDDVIKWKHFPRYWPLVRWIHRSPVDSLHNGLWRGDLMFSLICAWTNGWAIKRGAGDLSRHRTHYDATVMESCSFRYFVGCYKSTYQ